MRKPSAAMIVAMLSLFIALGGAGMAATGGNFILGKPNSATSATSLSAPIGGKALQLSNTSTAAGATALGFTVASGHPPFTVNSGAKVANLNADKLDGSTALANRIVGPVGTNKILLTISGLGYLQAYCVSNDAYIKWWNNTGGMVDLWTDISNSHFVGFSAAAGVGYDIAQRSANGDGGTVGLGVGSAPGSRRVAVLHAFVAQGAMGAPCRFQVQGTLWSSP